LNQYLVRNRHPLDAVALQFLRGESANSNHLALLMNAEQPLGIASCYDYILTTSASTFGTIGQQSNPSNNLPVCGVL
jgi:hypothetical protein